MSDAASEALKKARSRIDALDADLVRLISERARVASEIRDIKAAGGATGDHYRPAREAEVLRAAMRHNEAVRGPLANETVGRLMREIMSACLALESPLSVAYLGPEGTYTHTAANKHFGHAVDTRPKATIDEIFREVESNNTAYGVVPVENSTEGVVSHTLDRLAYTSLNICGEVWLPIHHHLLSRHARSEDITVVYAHTHSFGQCRQWLDAHLPNALREAVSSNAAGAKRVAETGQGAAIAGQSAGELYQLPVLASNIEDDPSNTTRFLVIGRKVSEPTGQDKTSVVMQLQKDRPGALVRALEPFASASIDLTRIESRPSRQGLWEYNFFIDLEGHQADPMVREALAATQQRVSFFRVLGSYPRAVL